MIEEIFDTFGFKEEEVKTYLSLLDSGPRTAGDLAKITGVSRPTLYGYLERLTTAGLVTQGMRRGVKIFAPEPAEKIRLLYKRKIEELRSREKMLDRMIPELNKRSGAHLLRPRMQFFEGRGGIESALEDLLTVAPGTMTLSFWPIRATMGATSEEFFRYHNIERIRRNIHVNAIWPRSQGADLKRYPFLGWGPEFKRELRYAPLGIEFTMGYWVYGHKVLFISSRAESYGFIMESAELAQTMAVQHDVVWKMSEPVPFDSRYAKPFLDELNEINPL
jgi:sugar-specific transcriptional regulator TrmB